MAKVRVICPNHGIINEIEMACMWLGRPPIPEVDNAYCPICGSKTIIERDKEHNAHWVYHTPTHEEQCEAKREEVRFYRKKYHDEFAKVKDEE